jgi:DNA-binding CsgD family transcriptional regulator
MLTPKEIDVAALVREGRTSKEIAEVLTISVSGVDFHRKQIRKKLGLTNEKSNLLSYLLSLLMEKVGMAPMKNKTSNNKRIRFGFCCIFLHQVQTDNS